MDKDVKRMVRRFVLLGYRRERGKRHVILLGPAGERLTLGDGTHDDGERVKKLRGKLRKAEAAGFTSR